MLLNQGLAAALQVEGFSERIFSSLSAMAVKKRGSNSNDVASPAAEPMLAAGPTGDGIPGDQDGTKLKRELGLLDGASIIIGIIVGSGIFVSPKGVLRYAGSVSMSLVVWALSGILSMMGALCYAELGICVRSNTITL